MERILKLYIKTFGVKPVETHRLTGAGSNRQYYRLSNASGGSVIGVVGTSVDENRAFVDIARHLEAKGLNVPHVICVSDDSLCYLQQDLGSVSLYDALAKGRTAGGEYDEEEIQLLRNTIRELPRLQVAGAEGMDWKTCYPVEAFDADSVMFDLNYFKYCFLKTTGIEFHEMRLEEDFRHLSQDLVCDPAGDGDGEIPAPNEMVFMYRDFQTRNIMLDKSCAPWFIDFQGGRRGPYYYDLASFLWQASAKFPMELREQLISEYYDSLSRYTTVPSREQFGKRLKLFVLFRILQVLGAYGFRGCFEKKQYFIDSIPGAVANLRQLLNSNLFPYPYLTEVLTELVEKAEYNAVPTGKQCGKGIPLSQPTASRYDGQGPLVVRVFSFSYKKGIPQDETGNGGGYVFDCRSTHNPGRYEEYRQLTGLDKPVIDFLEADGEITTFLESVYKLAEHHVERYISRGFTSLMFAFGCTGGQHRSVYSAQHLAEHLHKKYGIEVRICHREQNIQCTLQ